MNEQLQEKLVEILSQIQQGVKQAGSFTLEQLPDIAQQYVLWGRVSNVVTCSFLLLMVIFCFTLAYRSYVKPWFGKSYGERVIDTTCVGTRVLSPVFGVMILAIFIKELDLMVWLAPKVWLIKEIATIIK